MVKALNYCIFEACYHLNMLAGIDTVIKFYFSFFTAFLLFALAGRAQLREDLKGARALVDIEIKGNKITNRKIITRELNVAIGDTIYEKSRETLLLDNQQRLLNLPLFTTVKLSWENLTDSTIVLVIEVRERWYLLPEISLKLADRNFNVWWFEKNHDLRRIDVRADIKHSNLFGNLEQLGVILQGGYTQRFGLQYAKPYVDARQQHGVGGQVVYSRGQEMVVGTFANKLAFARSEQIYINKVFEAQAFYTYRPAYSSKHTIQVAYRNFKIGDTITFLNPDYFLNSSQELAYAELLYRLDLNYADNWNYALIGKKFSSIITQKVGWKGMSYQTQLQSEAAYMRRLYEKWYGALTVKGRISFPQLQPYPLVSALGYGDKYLRGFEYYVIDGSHYAMGRMAVKYELWKHTFKNIGLRFLPEIPIRIYPKIYADMGWVYNQYAMSSALNNKLLRSAGFGVDFVTAYDIKLKLEFSVNHLGQSGIFFHQKGN